MRLPDIHDIDEIAQEIAAAAKHIAAAWKELLVSSFIISLVLLMVYVAMVLNDIRVRLGDFIMPHNEESQVEEIIR